MLNERKQKSYGDSIDLGLGGVHFESHVQAGAARLHDLFAFDPLNTQIVFPRPVGNSDIIPATVAYVFGSLCYPEAKWRTMEQNYACQQPAQRKRNHARAI